MHIPLPEVFLYVPPGHLVQDPAPSTSEYRPDAQSTHVPGPDSHLYFPAGHAVQATAAASEYVPSSQYVHGSEPVAPLYSPATHASHGAPFGPVYPALHEQSVASKHCVSTGSVGSKQLESALAGQSVHAALPDMLLYFPAAQAVHVPLSGPVYPMLQAQAEAPFESVVELAGHVKHDGVPGAGAYLPSSQSPQYIVDMSERSFPAGQAVHGATRGSGLGGPRKPTLHLQSEALVAPVVIVELLGGHCTHTLAPLRE